MGLKKKLHPLSFGFPAPVDDTPPVIVGCPSDIVLPLGVALTSWTEPSATDDSGNPPSVVKSHQPGTNFSEGNTTVMYTFSDGAGNQANCSFVVTVTLGRSCFFLFDSFGTGSLLLTITILDCQTY